MMNTFGTMHSAWRTMRLPFAGPSCCFSSGRAFSGLPLEKRLEVKLDKHNVGYLPMRGDTLRTSSIATVSRPSVKEAFFVARPVGSHPDVLAVRRSRSANRWPIDLLGFREAVVVYCETIEQLVRKLVPLYARTLSVPLEYFDKPFWEPQ